MNVQNLGQLLNLLTLLPSAAYANTAAATGAAIDLNDYEGEAAVVLQVAAGGTGTLDVTIQDSADGSTGWANISGAAFTQVTTSASSQKIAVKTDSCKRYIRALGTIGTGPFTGSVSAVAAKKVRA